MANLKELPQSINLSLIDQILVKHGERNYSVLDVQRRGNSDNAGDHYLSEIIFFTIRIKVDNEEKCLDFIMKDMGKGLSDFILEVNGVEKEVCMYKDILPNVNKLLSSSITPEMYYHHDKVMILNDLSTSGYRISDRMKLLDYDHCKLALIALAKFHAGSLKYYEISPEKFNIVNEETLYNGSSDSIAYYFGKVNFKSVIKMLEKIPEGTQFVKGVKFVRDHFWTDANKAFAEETMFRVLNHGDFWTTNILYRYEEGKAVNCKLIDFQMTRFCPPTYDLYQFITISMDSSVRDDQLDNLLDIYVETLNCNLQMLRSSSKQLTRNHLDTILSETKVFGFISALLLTQIALCDPNDPLELSSVSKSDFREGFPKGNPYEKGYTQKQVQNHIISFLHFFRRKNYI